MSANDTFWNGPQPDMQPPSVSGPRTSEETFGRPESGATRPVIDEWTVPPLMGMRDSSQVRLHLLGRDGWKRTELKPRGFMAARNLAVPRAVFGATAIARQDFRLVKDAEIRDHKTNTVRREYWYEEI